MNPFDLNRTMLATGQELSPRQLGEQSWTNSFNDCMLTLSTVDCTDLVAQCVSAFNGQTLPPYPAFLDGVLALSSKRRKRARELTRES